MPPRIQLVRQRRRSHHFPSSWQFLLSALLLLVVCSFSLNRQQQQTTFVLAFSGSSSSSNSGQGNANSNSNSFTLFDRFRPECPASISCIQQFDPRLITVTNMDIANDDEQDDHVWVAVYRTSNNKPSVFVKDEFLNAMRLATGGIVATDNISTNGGSNTSQYFENTSSNNNNESSNNKVTNLQSSSTPVAVARLRPSDDFENTCTWILDKMQCSLKKENQDDACEGGSEHKEALSVAIDALLLYHLQQQQQQQQQKHTAALYYHRRTFHNAIRSKATLVGASLLEDRGFEPVQFLSKDMATHISSLDQSMAKYAQKYVETSTTKNPGARERAHRILSQLGRLDRDAEIQAAKAIDEDNNDNNDDEEYDPFASIKQWGL